MKKRVKAALNMMSNAKPNSCIKHMECKMYDKKGKQVLAYTWGRVEPREPSDGEIYAEVSRRMHPEWHAVHDEWFESLIRQRKKEGVL